MSNEAPWLFWLDLEWVKGCLLCVNGESEGWSGGRIFNESAVMLPAPQAKLADIFSAVKTGGYFNWMLLVLLSRVRRPERRCFVSCRDCSGLHGGIVRCCR